MLGLEELPVEFAPLLFQPQTQYPPGDDLDLLDPAMSTATEHHDVSQLVVPLRASCDVMHVAAPALATVQDVAQFAREHVLGV
jgi:hypothetical protein